MKPNHSFANWALAIAYSDLEDYEKALTCINIAFLNENTLYKRGRGTSERDLWTTRGFIYHKLGETEKGLMDLKEALNIDENNSFALRNLGILYHDLGEYNKSCELLKKAKTLGYEKTYDRFDIGKYMDYSCNNKEIEFKLNKLVDHPFVYPNPIIDVLSISNFDFENYNFRIFNFESEPVLTGKSDNKSINISNLPSGLYFLEVNANGNVYTFKIIKD